MGTVLETTTADPATGTQSTLAEMLADVMCAERVQVDDHFFDDLGADSLVMAKFCARVRKREDLPSVSMKDIYRYPTIRSLAESFAQAEADADAVSTPVPVRAPVPAEPAATASTREYIVCGTLQLLFFLGYAWAVALVGARAYEWISAAKGYAGDLPEVGGVRRRGLHRLVHPSDPGQVGAHRPVEARSRSASGAWATSASGSSRRWSGRTRWPC